jgi:hypothetical protein
MVVQSTERDHRPPITNNDDAGARVCHRDINHTADYNARLPGCSTLDNCAGPAQVEAALTWSATPLS